MKETLEELVAQRKGYKYLSEDGVSPYQGFTYDLKSRKQITANTLNTDILSDCGAGWNLATLKWIADNCMKLDGIIVECEIPKKAKIIVPVKSDGKFRTDIIKIKKIHSIESLFPALKGINERLKKYKPTNPITAEEMPPKSKIKKIMAQVGAFGGISSQVGAQVRDQVGAQVWVCAYHAVKEFFNLDYDHPAFELIRLGIMVVKVLGKFKVFGKSGKFLGEFE